MRVPTMRRNTAADQAFIEHEGRRTYLGKWGEAPTMEAYHRLCAEILSGRPAVDPQTITIAELALAFLEHCERIYTPKNGEASSEYGRAKAAMRPLVRFYGSLPASEFGPSGLRVLQESWVAEKREDKKTQRVCRRSVNTYTSIVRRCFRWAVSREMVNASTWHALQAVEPLRQGRTHARETGPVKPAPSGDVTRALEHVSRQVKAVAELQLLTGARPGELLTLKPGDVDTSGDVWTATLREHKNAHKGKERVLYFGPKAQAILKPFMLRPADSFLFSPREAEAERLAARHVARVTPEGQGNGPGTNRMKRPEVEPGERYTRHSYRRAIERGCTAAKVPMWTPYQLRHNAATNFRKQYGLDAAQVLLGHSELSTTQVYSELDAAKAVRVMAEIG